MRKLIIGVIVVLVVVALFKGCGPEQSEINRIGSSIDWGDGYYWDSSSESVKRTWYYD